jgi:hypothetical protein
MPSARRMPSCPTFSDFRKSSTNLSRRAFTSSALFFDQS